MHENIACYEHEKNIQQINSNDCVYSSYSVGTRFKCRCEINMNQQIGKLFTFLAYFPYFEKMKVGL
jgi:hypothetical protein